MNLEAAPVTLFTWHVVAGLTLLCRSGEVRLSLSPSASRIPSRSQFARLRVLETEAGRSSSVYFDLSDGAMLQEDALNGSEDVIFKRTLVQGSTGTAPPAPVLPYGLVFECRSGWEGKLVGHSLRSVQGLLPPRDSRDVKLIGWSLRTSGRLAARRWWKSKYLPAELADYEVPPERPAEDLVLYQTRVWDPGSGSNAGDRKASNERRVLTVRALRRAFGKRFVGGVVPSPYATTAYPDCISTVPAARASYLRLMRSCCIVVSTPGLHGSVPFKFPEYLAASRAIVTEPIEVTLPSELADGREILTFSTPDRCVEQCGRLLDDSHLRSSLRYHAGRYYNMEVRPDALIRNRLRDLAALPRT